MAGDAAPDSLEAEVARIKPLRLASTLRQSPTGGEHEKDIHHLHGEPHWNTRHVQSADRSMGRIHIGGKYCDHQQRNAGAGSAGSSWEQQADSSCEFHDAGQQYPERRVRKYGRHDGCEHGSAHEVADAGNQQRKRDQNTQCPLGPTERPKLSFRPQEEPDNNGHQDNCGDEVGRSILL